MSIKRDILRSIRLSGTACALLLTACAGDNVHMPEPDNTPAPARYEGETKSSIPVFPTFVPQTSPNYAVLTWADESQREATIEMGGFSVDISEVDMHIEIGSMTITGIECTKGTDGSVTLAQPDFSCMGGTYFTTGALTGTLTDGSLQFTLLYHPGSMPFEVRTEFRGTDD